jgi:hypothetical protein
MDKKFERLLNILRLWENFLMLKERVLKIVIPE